MVPKEVTPENITSFDDNLTSTQLCLTEDEILVDLLQDNISEGKEK